MLIWKLAFRNLFRHKTRLVLNMFLLVGAFSAIVLFKGFSAYVLNTMKTSVVQTQFAHLDVAKKSFWANAAVDQVSDKMIDQPDQLTSRIALHPEVAFVSQRVSFYGLVNTETKSIPSRLIGFDPTVEREMQKHMLFVAGGPFSDGKSAIIGSGLSKLLKTSAGGEVTLVSPTLDGGINAMDLKVAGVFSTGFSDVDNGTVFLQLADAKKVLDTDKVDQLLVGLKDDRTIDQVERKIATDLASPELELKKWSDLAELFKQVDIFYSFQNVVIELILLSLLILSVSNTTNMAIHERLGEIGTLRALGDYEVDIQKLFLLESVFLGALAVCIGIPVAYFLLHLVSSFEIGLVMPFTSRVLPLKMLAIPWAFAEASLVCFFSIILASLWPAYRGSRVSIVTALRAKF